MLHHVFAADSDIAFATISEEWGLITAVLTVLAIAALACFTIRTARVARSSFYIIGGCTAAGILVIQTTLNCLGTLDILPFTGVPFPLLSNGGTSMIGAWGRQRQIPFFTQDLFEGYFCRLFKCGYGKDV